MAATQPAIFLSGNETEYTRNCNAHYSNNCLNGWSNAGAASYECICKINRVSIVEEYLAIGESWLQPEMLLNFEASSRENINEIEEFPTQQIEWQDITTSQQQNNIQWVDIPRR